MIERWLLVVLVWASMSMAAGHADVQGSEWERIQRVGPPRMYSPSVERYRYGHATVLNPEFYPIPHTRELSAVHGGDEASGYRTPAQARYGWATRFHASSCQVRADRRSDVG